MQINATLVKGKARVQFGANKVRKDALEVSIQVSKCPVIMLTSHMNDVDHNDS